MTRGVDSGDKTLHPTFSVIPCPDVPLFFLQYTTNHTEDICTALHCRRLTLLPLSFFQAHRPPFRKKLIP